MKKLICTVITAMLVLSLPFTALAAGEKEEVIYVNLSASGQVTGVYAVNIISAENGVVRDYGTYSEVRNLTTTDPVAVNGDLITIETDSAEPIYYEGIMEGAALPWNVSVSYSIDGKAVDPAQLGGMSGALELRLAIEKNPASSPVYADNFALQISVTLPGEKVSNLRAEGATIANSGSDKQLAYIILPGKTGDFTVTADVTEFEMTGMSIAAVNMALDIDIDDEDFLSEIYELQDAVVELDDGVGSLKSGAYKLRDGAKALGDGLDEIESALKKLSVNGDDIAAASAQINAAMTMIKTELAKVEISSGDLSLLAEGSAAVLEGMDGMIAGLGAMREGITSYYAGLSENGITPSELAAKNKEAAGGLTAGVDQLKAVAGMLDPTDPAQAIAIEALNTMSAYSGDIAQLLNANAAVLGAGETLIAGLNAALDDTKGQESVAGGMKLMRENYALIDSGIKELASQLEGMLPAMEQLVSGIKQLAELYDQFDSGVDQYTDGVTQVSKGFSELNSGAKTLIKGIGSLASGVAELKEGTGEFVDQTADMDDQVSEKIDDMIQSIGGTGEIVSFTSEKNTGITSLQFVMQTAPITVPEEEQPEEAEEELTFWDRVTGLFGG